MKKLLTTALMGFASAALLASSAQAQSEITSVPNDVILGFQTPSGTGSSLNLEVDLGPVSQFYNATPGQVISLNGATGLAVADLVATYGAGWASNSSLTWGVAATDGASSTPFPADSMWVTDPQVTPGTLNTPWNTAGRFAQQTGTAHIASLYTGLNQNTSTTNSSVSAVLPTSQGDSYTFQDNFNPGASFGYFNPTIDNAVTNTDGSGNSISDFYQLITTTTPGVGKDLGVFELNSNGTFEFVAAGAVPEPSSIGLTGVGFLSLIGMVALRRRRSVTA